MTYRFEWSGRFALLALSLAATGMTLVGQESQQAQYSNAPGHPATEIPSAADAPRVTSGLLQALHEPSSLTRASLVDRVDQSPAFDEITALPLLQDLLQDSDPLVRESALHALLRRDNEANPTLSERDVADVQGQEAELAKVHFAAKKDDTRTLRDLILSGDAVVQESAFNALASRDALSAVQVLHSEFLDKDSLSRLQTLQLLIRSVYTNAPADLITTLQMAASDEDPLVRDYAQSALNDMQVNAIHAP